MDTPFVGIKNSDNSSYQTFNNTTSSNNRHSHSGSNVFGRLFWSCKTIEQKEQYIAEKLVRKDERRFIPHSSIGKIIAAIPLAIAFIVVGLLTVILWPLTLGKFNLFSIIFRKNTQSLKGNNLSKIDFYKVIAQDVELKNKRLRALRDMNFSGTDLQNCVLKEEEPCLGEDCMFSNGLGPRNLSYANLSGQNFDVGHYGASFHNINLSHSILHNVNFNNTQLEDIDFSGSDATGSTFHLASIHNISFRNAILVNASFVKNFINDRVMYIRSNINREQMDFKNADLSGAKGIPVGIGNQFEGIILDHQSSFELDSFPLNSSVGRDMTFNHTNNPDSGSILTAIHSIPSKYKQHKITLLKKLIQSIYRQDWIDKYHLQDERSYLNEVVSETGDAFVDILTREDSPYLENPVIAQFFHQHLLPKLITEANHTTVEINGALLHYLLGLGLKSCQQSIDDHQQLLLDPIKDNACLNQILFLARSSDNKDLKKKANQLFSNYIKWLSSENESLAQCFTKQYIDNILMIDTSDDADDDDKKDLTKAYQSSYIFIANDDDDVKEPSSCIICDHDFYQQKLTANQPTNESSVSWPNDLYVFESVNRVENGGYENQPHWKTDTLQKYPLLYRSYEQESRANRFPAFIKSLQLGRYEQAFLEATQKTREEDAINFVAQPDKDALSELFKDKYQKSSHKEGFDKLSENYLKTLDKIFDFTNKTKKQQAIVLLCLSSIFARYSSSKMFGKELDSPDALRAFALALLNQAVDYDSTIIDKDQLNLWRDQLTGSHGKFPCTAVLSGSMIRFIKKQVDPDYTDTLAWLLPPKWV